MRNKSLIIISLFITCNAIAAGGDTFQIYDEVHGVPCTYSISEYGYAISEDPAYMGTGICWDKKMMDKANFYIRSHKK